VSDANKQELNFLAKLVIAITIALVAVGSLRYGFTFRTIARFCNDLLERPEGLMRFRFILQPMMAVILAFQDGLKDARSGRAPYFATVLRDPRGRIGLLNEGLNATARIIVIGLAMDVIYQAVVLETFYPNEAFVVALLLAFVPYLIARGLVARMWRARKSA
jgi:hypothetical protein